MLLVVVGVTIDISLATVFFDLVWICSGGSSSLNSAYFDLTGGALSCIDTRLTLVAVVVVVVVVTTVSGLGWICIGCCCWVIAGCGLDVVVRGGVGFFH